MARLHPTHWVSAVLLALLLSGCGTRHELDLSALGEVELVQLREDGNVVSSTLSPGSEQHRLLVEWLTDNRFGWQPLLATMDRDIFTIQGERFSLHFGKYWTVLTYRNSAGEPTHLIREASRQRPDFLPEE